jgi:ankyrin repeat protein
LIIGALLQESFKSILHDFYVAYPQASIVITVLTLAVASIFLWRRRTDHKSASPQKMEKLVEPEGLTELMTASEKGDIDRVQELLIYDPMTINKTSTNGATALMFAVRNNHELVVQYLLAHGADAEFKTTGGSTALSIAQRHKFDKIIKLLPNKGRDKTSMR